MNSKKPYDFLPEIYNQYSKICSSTGRYGMSDHEILSQIRVSEDAVASVYANVENVDIQSVKVAKMSKYLVTLSVVMSQNGGAPYDRTFNIGYPGVRSLIEVNGDFVLIKEVRPDGEYWTFPGGAFDDYYSCDSEDFRGLGARLAIQSEVKEEIGFDVDADRFVSFGVFNPFPAYLSTSIYGFALPVSEREFSEMIVDTGNTEEIIKDLSRFNREDLIGMNLCGESLALFGLYNLRNGS